MSGDKHRERSQTNGRETGGRTRKQSPCDEPAIRWKRFNAPKEDILWYYESMADIFTARFSGHHLEYLAKEFDNTVRKLKDDCQSGPPMLH
jgi:hypothetical protein